MCKCFTKPFLENIKDLKDPNMWRGILAELIGTLILVFIGCGSCLGRDGEGWESFSPTQVQISLTFGLAVATMVWAIAHVSGGHINPAVTVAMLITRKITIIRALLYITAQCIGAVTGAAILLGVSPDDVIGNLGSTTFNYHITWQQAFTIEAIITFVLVLTVFSSVDSNRKDLAGSAPLTIGFSVTLCHLFAIKYTGSSMNPARSFGPAIVIGSWNSLVSSKSNETDLYSELHSDDVHAIWANHWIYWSAPIVGAVIAGLLYEVILAKNASTKKMKYFLLTSKYDSCYQVSQQAADMKRDDDESAKMADRDERV